MAKSSKLVVMVSSRCDDKFPQDGPSLSETRKALKKELEAVEVFGRKLFEVWINEQEPPQGGTWDSWEVCLRAVRECDILIVLANGNAGWAGTAADVGICHDELRTALSTAPAKVRLIALPQIPVTNDAAGERNQRFQEYVQTQSLFRGGKVATAKELKERVREAVLDAVVALAQTGVQEANRGKYHSGEALDWSRLDFRARAGRMRDVLCDVLSKRPGATKAGDDFVVPLAGAGVLMVPTAIPAALTVAPAKEMVGQPFLRDHLRAAALPDGGGGPVHVIACQKTATEAQAIRLLGFPDAEVVSAPFGVFVADNVQKIQFAFLANCRDDANTRHAAQRFFEWMVQTGEEALVAKRAAARARIVRAIASEAAP